MEFKPECVICLQNEETMQHLFFDCNHHTQSPICRRAEIWDSEITWATGLCRGKSFRSLLLKLALAAGVYHIWILRNSRVFGGSLGSSSAILSCSDENIRLRVCTLLQLPNSIENQRLCSQWNISNRVLGSAIS